MRLLIEPNDVLLFRELKPFTAGEAHLARSDLPLPQTIAGAIRSKILLKENFSEEAKEIIGYNNDEPEFHILGSGFYKNEEYFNVPLDIAKSKEDEKPFYVTPKKLDWRDEITIFSGKKGIQFESVKGYLGLTDLSKYLVGNLKEEDLVESLRSTDELFSRESRVGIKLGNSKITEEGYFYKVEYLRLNEGVRLSAWFGEKSDEMKKYTRNEGLIKIGGENRFARYTVEDFNPLKVFDRNWPEIKGKVNENKKFKLYLASPTLNEVNGKYSWDIKGELENNFNITIKQVYPLIAKPLKVSGWDYANSQPRGLKYAIPGGSVYFVEFEGNLDYSKPYVKLGKLNKLGYGLALIGVW